MNSLLEVFIWEIVHNTKGDAYLDYSCKCGFQQYICVCMSPTQAFITHDELLCLWRGRCDSEVRCWSFYATSRTNGNHRMVVPKHQPPSSTDELVLVVSALNWDQRHWTCVSVLWRVTGADRSLKGRTTPDLWESVSRNLQWPAAPHPCFHPSISFPSLAVPFSVSFMLLCWRTALVSLWSVLCFDTLEAQSSLKGHFHPVLLTFSHCPEMWRVCGRIPTPQWDPRIT